jgi:hypothetical protein
VAASMRHNLGQALTKRDAKVDAWITVGFQAEARKMDRRTRFELETAETYALVKRKLSLE